MKNYLFAPFKDDDEKVDTFNYFKNYLSKGHRHEFIMFIGRLESTYDVIISELKERVKYQEKQLITANDGINDLNDVLRDVQAESIEQIKENEDLRKACKLLKEEVIA